MRTFLLALALLTACGLSALANITYVGGDGSSIEKAIVIKGAKGEGDGVPSEYAYLRQHYPGYKMGRQSLLNEKDRNYDLLEFKDASGNPHKIYFEITDFFGKF